MENDYEPCLHFGNENCDEKCACSERGMCERFCVCHPLKCKKRFKGCNCNTKCGTNQCSCFSLKRECDSSLCSKIIYNYNRMHFEMYKQ